MPRKPSIAKQAEQLCSCMPDTQDKSRAIELATNVLFLEKKLGETRKIANTEPSVVEYDNGGGQSGTRVSPWVQSYTALLKTYQSAIRQLSEMLAMDDEDVDEQLDVLYNKYDRPNKSAVKE